MFKQTSIKNLRTSQNFFTKTSKTATEQLEKNILPKTNSPHKTSSKYLPDLEAIKKAEPGDLVCFYPTKLTGRLISAFTQNNIVHLGIVSKIEPQHGPLLVEVKKSGIRQCPLTEIITTMNTSQINLLKLLKTPDDDSHIPPDTPSFETFIDTSLQNEIEYSKSKVMRFLPFFFANMLTLNKIPAFKIEQLNLKRVASPKKTLYREVNSSTSSTDPQFKHSKKNATEKPSTCSEFIARALREKGLLPEATKTSYFTPGFLIKYLQDKELVSSDFIPLNKQPATTSPGLIDYQA